MQRPTFYSKHNKSLEKFANLFNSEKKYPRLRIEPIQEETFRDDGFIIDAHTNKRIGFDWEIRDRYFSNCHFQLPTLRQFERKIIKDEIDISIQCDSTETGIIVAWHEDFKMGKRFIQPSKTDFSHKENAWVRETNHFRVYSYENISDFKEMLIRAFVNNQYNHNSF